MHLVAIVFGLGRLRPGPGTWGSLGALPLTWALHVLGGPWLVLIVALLLIPLGVAAAKAEMAATGDSDPSHVVIDEVVGQMIALLPVTFGAWAMGAGVLALWPGWIAAFVLFRLFDIWKPWLVGKLDARGDVWGLMADDIVAGVFAALVTILFAGLAHGLLM
ncbi:phosphatidylglycerophosphatase A [Pseudoroseicyclus sp. CLL3-39]|uniref:Phosphatidylglycerophosphatase A n=2 Tax=Pseudoroseicyclus tamaricis TaxID=2705421 RepID=A0A6B2K0U7_9RHOB|nr:phosphatidylglycerophosphatase A [Pseudoroseicyclus tamaricis]NDV01312.1 phosphatidylglycerophosphatase A [Pseudoroseicyclus tamaricis]